MIKEEWILQNIDYDFTEIRNIVNDILCGRNELYDLSEALDDYWKELKTDILELSKFYEGEK